MGIAPVLLERKQEDTEKLTLRKPKAIGGKDAWFEERHATGCHSGVET
jgi:hypothetical protein